MQVTGRATRLLLAVLIGVLVVASPAEAKPVPLPTVDPSAPTPTAPLPGSPPTGSAPDGSTVGGSRLHTSGLVVADGAPPLPDGIDAAGWLVADLDTGVVLAARDPHGRYYPASTLKTLTLLTVAHRLTADTVVTATDADEQVEGTRVGLVKGGQYPVPLLFQALILGSGNDVANALARANGGVDVTVAQMNARARSLGAFDTVAGTPSGLDVAGQSSSPYDLALIFRALLADQQTAAVLTTPRIQIPPEMGKPGFQVDDENPLLFRYAGDLGGKNGFTDAARHTFVTAAARGGRRLVVTLMRAERHPGISEYDQAARLLDWGFTVPADTRGVGTLVRPGQVPTAAPAASASAAPRRAHSVPAASAAKARSWQPLAALGAGVVLLALLAGAAALTLRRRVSAADR